MYQKIVEREAKLIFQDICESVCAEIDNWFVRKDEHENSLDALRKSQYKRTMEEERMATLRSMAEHVKTNRRAVAGRPTAVLNRITYSIEKSRQAIRDLDEQIVAESKDAVRRKQNVNDARSKVDEGLSGVITINEIAPVEGIDHEQIDYASGSLFLEEAGVDHIEQVRVLMDIICKPEDISSGE